MDIERRIELIKAPPTEEVITEQDLKELLETKQKPIAYDGFETSGLLHLGSGVLRAIKIQDMLEAKCDFILWIADWFAYINNKMGGDLELIKKTGEYYIEGWKACGVDIKKVKILWTSDAVKDPDYWKGVIDVAKNTTVKRTIRASPIMGRNEAEIKYTAQLLYPMMQAWDPFYFGADILQLGMDQRHATMLSRELAEKLGFSKRICVHHHLLAGLQAGKGRMGKDDLDTQIENKMSKSKPETAIFIHDTKEEIKRKIMNAYCPEKIVEGNPIIEIWKYIILRKFSVRTIKRPQKFGGDLQIESYQQLEDLFKKGDLHPLDLKNETIEALDEILEPIRKHFEKDKPRELYEIVKNAKITR
ncbi:MAG: tyrosine--tRNA ligase [Candidatus Aenigmarchaeota archaeon]|nr:tyrosine--tRNA ligase [Candidatus Aenigmarchaeota archaeon]MBU5688706.1 tyrosine--tRNA ligase [Candidatus Aenigmarchaeota archaeon]